MTEHLSRSEFFKRPGNIYDGVDSIRTSKLWPGVQIPQ